MVATYMIPDALRSRLKTMLAGAYPPLRTGAVRLVRPAPLERAAGQWPAC